MKIKIKEAYLLVLIVLGLVSLSVYSTYALFTKEVTIDNVVSFNSTLSLSDSNLVEYELVTLNPNETKIIELRVSNSSTSTLYYGCWYETLSTNPDITIGMYLEKSNVPSTGTITTTETKTLVVGIVNNSTSTTLVNLGVVGSTTENLGLSSSRIIITDTFSPAIIVTDEVLAANTTTTTENINLEYTTPQRYEVTLSPGTYLLETWGAQGATRVTKDCKKEDDDGEEYYLDVQHTGGLGGYSKGTLKINADTTIYVYVGGEGSNERINYSGSSFYKGGFNGGGIGSYAPGGGASDIRIGADSLYARVIVAGGGGGGAASSCLGIGAGRGGGLNGEEGGRTPVTPIFDYGGTGGTQTSSGTDKTNKCNQNDTNLIISNSNFGNGGSGKESGGGGGWYGGGLSCGGGAGGGSGYVYTSSSVSSYPDGCLLNSTYYLTDAETINEGFTDFDGSRVNGHSGNGAVRISGDKEVTMYTIPKIHGLSDITISIGEVISLTKNVTYMCESGSTSCSYIGPDTLDTSALKIGTYTIKYKIKSAVNKIYIYERTINVIDDPRIDNSGANFPQFTDALIPVVSNELASTWVKADLNGDKVTATCDALGDVDDDGKVDNLDVVGVGDFINNVYTLNDSQKVCGDVDGDGLITKNDYDLLYKYYNGKVTTFPKGEPLSTVTGTVYDTPYVWYNYNNKQWANAVLVSEPNRQKYSSSDPGTEIAEEDILAFYVWIPRYKYKVWNINKVIGTDSYNARTTGIDIVFEDGTNSTGTISCTYSYATPSSTAGSPNETCTGSNGDYYTHPAFTFGGQELKGFWMAKFELSSSSPTTSNGGGNSSSLTTRILPNVTSWRGNYLKNFNTVVQNMQVSNNIYGLPTSKIKTDSHIITNMEWGAVVYLTNSKYGRCTNGSCTEVSLNGYGDVSTYTTKTGCGPISSGSTSYGTTCNAYNTTLGKTASTTGNIYGVYDMSGGGTEYVMSNTLDASNKFNVSNSGFTSNWYTDSNKKYIVSYAYGTTTNNQTSNNRTRLGDATGEILLSSVSNGGWYSDYSVLSSATSPWMHRGGSFFGSTNSGIFVYYGGEASNSQSNATSRAVLTVVS